MESYIKSLKKLSLFFLFLIFLSYITAVIQFNWLSEFFWYFEYHTVFEWFSKCPDEIMPYQYVSDIFFGKTTEGIGKLTVFAIAYLSFLGYFKSKKIFVDDVFEMINALEIFSITRASLSIIVVFLIIYLIALQISNLEIYNVTYQILVLFAMFAITSLFTNAMNNHVNCFNNYQKTNEYTQYLKKEIVYLVNVKETHKKRIWESKTLRELYDIVFEVFYRRINFLLITMYYHENLLSIQIITAMLSILIIYAGLLLHFNLLSILIMFLYVIYWFIGLSVLSYTIRLKSTIFLTNGEILNDVYVIEENLKRPHIKVINENNEKTVVMKSSIIKIVNEVVNFDLEPEKQSNPETTENNAK